MGKAKARDNASEWRETEKKKYDIGVAIAVKRLC